MKFLVDNQLPVALARHLRKNGHDCEHVLDLGLTNASDTDICRYAERENRVIISKKQLYDAVVFQFAENVSDLSC